jgi:hypothetical protein
MLSISLYVCPCVDLICPFTARPPVSVRSPLQYTSKMEGMLNDLATAETQAAEFRAHLAAKRVALPRGMEFSVQVLTTGFWPSFPKVRPAAQALQRQQRAAVGWLRRTPPFAPCAACAPLTCPARHTSLSVACGGTSFHPAPGAWLPRTPCLLCRRLAATPCLFFFLTPLPALPGLPAGGAATAR